MLDSRNFLVIVALVVCASSARQAASTLDESLKNLENYVVRQDERTEMNFIQSNGLKDKTNKEALALLNKLAFSSRCDANSLATLQELDECAQLSVAEWPRLHQIFRHYGYLLVQRGCNAYLNTKFEQAYVASRRLPHRFEVIKEDYELQYDWTKLNADCATETDCVIGTADLARVLRNLAGEGQRNVYGGREVEKRDDLDQFEENFDYNWKQFVEKPCVLYAKTFGDLAEKTLVAAQYSSNPADQSFEDFQTEFFESMSQPFQDVVYRYFVCKAINQNKVDVREVFHKLAQEDTCAAEKKHNRMSKFFRGLPAICATVAGVVAPIAASLTVPITLRL